MLGGAPEVESRAAAPGGDETGRCAAFTKDTKTANEGNRRLRRLEQIRGRLPPAGLPEWITLRGTHKGAKIRKGHKGIGRLECGAEKRPSLTRKGRCAIVVMM